jgi:hypothetical protein
MTCLTSAETPAKFRFAGAESAGTSSWACKLASTACCAGQVQHRATYPHIVLSGRCSMLSVLHRSYLSLHRATCANSTGGEGWEHKQGGVFAFTW